MNIVIQNNSEVQNVRQKEKVYLTLTQQERKLAIDLLLKFRNNLIRKNGPAEDVDDLIIKLTKAH